VNNSILKFLNNHSFEFFLVFVAAIIAVWLENWREERGLRKWLRQYLKTVHENLKSQCKDSETHLKYFESSLNHLKELALEDNKTLTEDDWNSLQNMTYTTMELSWLPTLRGEASQILSPRLVSLFEKEDLYNRESDRFSQLCSEIHQKFVVPIALEHRTPDKHESPLDFRERNAIKYFCDVADYWLKCRRKHYETQMTLLEKLEREGYSR
jgi:hypothetical protein